MNGGVKWAVPTRGSGAERKRCVCVLSLYPRTGDSGREGNAEREREMQREMMQSQCERKR